MLINAAMLSHGRVSMYMHAVAIQPCPKTLLTIADLCNNLPNDGRKRMCHKKPRLEGMSFTSGAYSLGGLVGVRGNSRKYPWTSLLPTTIVRSVCPTAHFSSTVLIRNIKFDMHVDKNVALSKPGGGVRALVMGDVFRRLVSRTLAQQFAEQFKQACAPFQYALSTRAGPEALVRAATEADPRTTILGIDGVGAYDHISRASMLGGLRDHAQLSGLPPFAAMFYARSSRYLFYDAEGRARSAARGGRGAGGSIDAGAICTREAECAVAWLRLHGFEAPSWTSLLDGAAPSHAAEADSVGPPTTRKGWQRCAGAAVEKRALELFFSDLDPAFRALLLSQSGPGASCAMTVLPTGPDFAVPSDEFRIMLLRRLRMPLPWHKSDAAVGGRWMIMETTGQRVGVLAHRAGPLERAAARVCREARARVAASTALRDMNLDLAASGDARRIEVVANGLPIWRGVQVAVDTTLVSPVQRGKLAPGATLCLDSPSNRQQHASAAPTLSSASTGVAGVASSCSASKWADASEQKR